jgi:phosphoribosylformylglycinamidine synthase
MINFFEAQDALIYAVKSNKSIDQQSVKKLSWLFGEAKPVDKHALTGGYVGPRKEMITPWSTNAVEITQNMGICHIERIEMFSKAEQHAHYDAMLQTFYSTLDQDLFTIHHNPEPIIDIEDIGSYNNKEGLALNDNEVAYLEALSIKIGRKLTDSEIFGFSQVNSEHCRHKIFNRRIDSGAIIISAD